MAPGERLRVGILCDYGFTLLPEGGIGVFLFNLIEGLQALPDPPRLVLQIHPGQHAQVEPYLRARGWEVELFPPAPEANAAVSSPRKRQFQAGVTAAEVLFARLYARLHGIQLALRERFACYLRRRLRREIDAARNPAVPRPMRFLRAAAMATLAALSAPLVWLVAWATVLFFEAMVPIAMFPLLVGIRGGKFVLNRWPGEIPAGAAPPPAPDCDVWFLPHARTDFAVAGPQVTILWDLAHHHVRGVFPEQVGREIDAQFRHRARKATRLYCGSQNVVRKDLQRLIPFAMDRVRVFPLAPPADYDWLEPIPAVSEIREEYDIRKPYVFYPAGVSLHKNHARLVAALGILRRELGHPDLELVCTGRPILKELQAELQRQGLEPAVHFLDMVRRSEIAALYAGAAAVPLPSLYEGYGLPVLEAIQHGCPITCADIPAFRELLAGSHDAVAFFDPYQPRAIAEAIHQTLQQRERYVAQQREIHLRLKRRTWVQVAEDFRSLFHEAAAAATPAQATPQAA